MYSMSVGCISSIMCVSEVLSTDLHCNVTFVLWLNLSPYYLLKNHLLGDALPAHQSKISKPTPPFFFMIVIIFGMVHKFSKLF